MVQKHLKKPVRRKGADGLLRTRYRIGKMRALTRGKGCAGEFSPPIDPRDGKEKAGRHV